MKKQTAWERIAEYNVSEIESRKNLPNLFEMIKMAKDGDMDIVDRYFYGYKIVEKLPYGGRLQSYEVNKVKFWDKPTDIFLNNIKKKYTKDVAIGEQNSFGGRKVNYKFSVCNFEESEIDEMFYRYLLSLIKKIKIENFVKDTESKTLNGLRNYIRIDFENNWLKKERNERMGLERVQVDGKMYWVKNKEEEVFFDDINCGQNEDGENMHFLDVIGNDDVYNGVSAIDFTFTSKKFIEENLEEALTKNQYEKWELLVEHVNKHGIESILDKYTGKIKKTAVAKIFYPNKSERSTTVINKLIERMNTRVEKVLDNAGVEYATKSAEEVKELEEYARKSSEVRVYRGGYTEDEVTEYFERHIDGILTAYREGRLTFDKGSKSMLPSLPSMLELPFEVYETWINSGFKTKKEIIREWYNPEKFKMKAGKKEVIEVIPVKEYVEKNDMYINPTDLKEIRKQSKLNK